MNVISMDLKFRNQPCHVLKDILIFLRIIWDCISTC